MKFLGIIFLFFLLFATTDAQFPPIGTIDFYGLQTISERQIREALIIKEDDAMLKSKEEADAIEKRLASLPNVAEAKINPVCCTGDGKTIPRTFSATVACVVTSPRRSAKFA